MSFLRTSLYEISPYFQREFIIIKFSEVESGSCFLTRVAKKGVYVKKLPNSWAVDNIGIQYKIPENRYVAVRKSDYRKLEKSLAISCD